MTTTEQYWPIALNYLLTSPDATFKHDLPKIDGIPNDHLRPTINDLETAKLISVKIGGGIMVEEIGEDYLEHHKAGLEQIKYKPLVDARTITIGNNNSFDKTHLSQDNNLYSPKTITNNDNNKPKTSITERLYWIAGIIVAIIAIYQIFHAVKS